MRYLITGEWNKHRVMRVIMIFFLVYILFFWITNFLMYFHHMGLSSVSVINYYRGSEDDFIPPKSFIGLLEVTHAHLFAMGILLVTLTHLLLFIPGKDRVKVVFSVLVLGAGLLDILSGWLVLYVHPLFSYLKIGSFLVLQGGLGLLLCCLMIGLFSRRKLSYSDQSQTEERNVARSSRVAKKLASASSSRHIINCVPIFLLFYAAVSKADSITHEVKLYREARYAMGTVLAVSLCHTSKSQAYEVFDMVFARLKQIEESISEWHPESDISRLQSQTPNLPLFMNPIAISFLRFARKMAILTQGRIDVTIGRVTKSKVGGAKALTIEDLIILDDSSAMMRKPGAVFDTGALGKGFALDIIAAELRHIDISCAFLDFGGSSMVGIGKPPGASGWLVKTLKGEQLMQQDFSVSTSESYLKGENGQSRSHIVNPVTEVYVERDSKVSVYGPSAGVADALSTWAIIDGAEVIWRELQGVPEMQSVRFEVQ